MDVGVGGRAMRVKAQGIYTPVAVSCQAEAERLWLKAVELPGIFYLSTFAQPTILETPLFVILYLMYSLLF